MHIFTKFLIGIVIILSIITISIIIIYSLGIKPTIVISGSMNPKIPTGSLCFIDTKYPYDDLKVDDVIVYIFQNNRQVIHRVISITDKGIETKGDANDFSDRISTNKNNYYGKCIFSIPYIGYVALFIRDGNLRLVEIFGGLFLLSLLLYILLRKKKKYLKI